MTCKVMTFEKAKKLVFNNPKFKNLPDERKIAIATAIVQGTKKNG